MKLALSCCFFLYFIWLTECIDKAKNRACYDAKICIHNNHEKCGVDSKGRFRRFLDTCDIMEYNCLRETDYVKTTYDQCSNLSPMKETLSGNITDQSDGDAQHQQQATIIGSEGEQHNITETKQELYGEFTNEKVDPAHKVDPVPLDVEKEKKYDDLHYKAKLKHKQPLDVEKEKKYDDRHYKAKLKHKQPLELEEEEYYDLFHKAQLKHVRDEKVNITKLKSVKKQLSNSG